jgi:phage terminase large subunit-like protein
MQRMITCKEIDDYLQYVKDHPKWINSDRKKLIKNIVKPTLKRKDVIFDEKTFKNCIAYCEKNYYPLFPYEKFELAFFFMYHKDDGEPIFRKIVNLEGRGNGKDGFAAPVCNFFQTPLYGVKNYNIEMVANSEQQIKDTFKIPYDMLSGNVKFRGKFRVTKEEIENYETSSVLRYNASGSKTKDGKRPGLVFFNEYHAYENYDQINVYESGLGKVKHNRIWIITTNGYVREGPLDDLLDECVRVLETGNNPTGIFPFICRLDRRTEIGKEEQMHKANPSMEFLPTLKREIMLEYLEAKSNPKKMQEYITKRCNLPEQKEEMAVTSWSNILACSYRDCKKKTARKTQDTRGKLALIGIDYADVRDFASAGRLTIDDDGNHIWRQHTWISAESPYLNGIKFPLNNKGLKEYQDFEIVNQPTIPIDAIIDWIEEQMMDYQVVKILMDTYRYQLFKEKFEERGISIESRNNPGGLVCLIRKLPSACGIIAPKLEKLFAEKKINYGPSAIMRWYTNNTALKQDKFGNYMYVKIEPIRRKNDGFMAFVAAEFKADLLKENIIYV